MTLGPILTFRPFRFGRSWSGRIVDKPAMEPDKSGQDDAPILVVPCDAAWPGLFAQERAILEALLAQWLVGPIEHVGSTAVPELAAKPVIDIMAGVKSLGDARRQFLR